MSNSQESFLSGANIDFIEGLFARYLEDPTSVDPSWRGLFDSQRGRGSPVFINGNGHARGVPQSPTPRVDTSQAQLMALQSRVDQTIVAFRVRGHLLAKLDPLGRPRPALDHIADLGMVNANHFS